MLIEINEFIAKPVTHICNLSIRNSQFRVIILEICLYAKILETLLMPILDPVLEKLHLICELYVRKVWLN